MASVNWMMVLDCHKDHPEWTAPQIAEKLGCTSSYVRATAQRRGLDLPKAIPPNSWAYAGARLAALEKRVAQLEIMLGLGE
ncbi:MAG: hypothetical protein GY952_14005 [Rhodobacteraceae bacterium]|nr:hypothetical protein [Paracoccaceae bacterium]